MDFVDLECQLRDATEVIMDGAGAYIPSGRMSICFVAVQRPSVEVRLNPNGTWCACVGCDALSRNKHPNILDLM
jgi:hypothetical protein